MEQRRDFHLLTVLLGIRKEKTVSFQSVKAVNNNLG